MLAPLARFLALLLLLFPTCVLAQDPPATGEVPSSSSLAAPSQNDVQELLRLLGDQRVVDWLKQNATGAVPALAAEPQTSSSLLGEIEARMAAARSRISALVGAWSNFPLVPRVLATAWRAELTRGEALRSQIYILVFLFVGAGFEWLFWQYFHPIHMRHGLAEAVSIRRRLTSAAARLLLQLVALTIFAIGAIGAFIAFDWPPFLERIVVDCLIGVIALRLAAMLSRFVTAPRSPELRLVPLSNALALKVHRWMEVVAAVAITAFVVSDALTRLARSESGSADVVAAALAVSVILGAFVAVSMLAMIWSLSRAIGAERLKTISAAIESEGLQRLPSSKLVSHHARFEPVAIKVAPIVLSVVVVLAYVCWVFGARELMWTILIFGFFPAAAHMVRAIVDHIFDTAEIAAAADLPTPVPTPAAAPVSMVATAASTGLPPTEAAIVVPSLPPVTEDIVDEKALAADRFATYRPIARRLARFVLAVAALTGLAAAWGANIVALSDSPTIAGRAVKVAIDIIAALLIADLIWGWAKGAIDRRLAGYVPPPSGESPGPEARMATLLPLLRNILLVSIIVLLTLTVLSSVGVNIAPLLAGAGIAGVAIGFGTQSLVRDIVSGIFFLLDDAFRVGEYIEMGDLRGTVESMSLRSLRVRHHRGAVHSIPFGELKSLTNYSRDWAILKLEFRVPFDTDLMLVKKIVKRIGAELQANPAYGSYILEPLKSQGVRRMEEFNMVIGVKFMAKPGAQWVIRRDAYQKLRDAFDQNGIMFAQRNVKVEVLSDRDLSDEEKNAVAGAAQEAIERRSRQTASAD